MPDNKSDEKSVGVEKIEYCLESLEKSTTPAAFVYSPEEKNVKRKIDRAFLPLVILILFTQVTFETPPLFASLHSWGTSGSLLTRHPSTRRRSWVYWKTRISQRTSLDLLGK